eukprot:1692850-Pleurochrysis_carterae.AAC.1
MQFSRARRYMPIDSFVQDHARMPGNAHACLASSYWCRRREHARQTSDMALFGAGILKKPMRKRLNRTITCQGGRGGKCRQTKSIGSSGRCAGDGPIIIGTARSLLRGLRTRAFGARAEWLQLFTMLKARTSDSDPTIGSSEALTHRLKRMGPHLITYKPQARAHSIALKSTQRHLQMDGPEQVDTAQKAALSNRKGSRNINMWTLSCAPRHFQQTSPAH